MEEQAAESFLGREDVNHIFALRREHSRLQRILIPMEELTVKLARQKLPGIDDDARVYFRDVRDHVRRVGSRVDGLRDALTCVFEFSTLLEQQRVGTITRQLASWAAILAVPTAFAGIYGMNFENMPELHTRYGYYFVIIAILMICFWLYVRFRRTGWL
jgi:magnesium transporter